MTERTCAACGYHRAKRAGGGKAGMGVRCPNCGERVDSHAGHIDKGEVFACEEGRPPMREARYHCRDCGPTAISPKKCEPKGVGHD